MVTLGEDELQIGRALNQSLDSQERVVRNSYKYKLGVGANLVGMLSVGYLSKSIIVPIIFGIGCHMHMVRCLKMQLWSRSQAFLPHLN